MLTINYLWRQQSYEVWIHSTVQILQRYVSCVCIQQWPPDGTASAKKNIQLNRLNGKPEIESVQVYRYALMHACTHVHNDADGRSKLAHRPTAITPDCQSWLEAHLIALQLVTKSSLACWPEAAFGRRQPQLGVVSPGANSGFYCAHHWMAEADMKELRRYFGDIVFRRYADRRRCCCCCRRLWRRCQLPVQRCRWWCDRIGAFLFSARAWRHLIELDRRLSVIAISWRHSIYVTMDDAGLMRSATAHRVTPCV